MVAVSSDGPAALTGGNLRLRHDLEQNEAKQSGRGSGNTRRGKPTVKANPPKKETKVKRGGFIRVRMAVVAGIAAVVIGLWMAFGGSGAADVASQVVGY